MASTTVVSIKKAVLQKRGYRDFLHWAEDPQHVYIGRNMVFYVPGTIKSKWANPFAVKTYGREGCLEQYRAYVISSGLVNDIMELDGKELGCWCKPDGCHGDVLVELLTQYKAYLASLTANQVNSA